MTALSRRLFLRGLAGLPLASVVAARSVSAQGLGQFGSEGPPPCNADAKPTPASPAGPDYKPNSPQRASLVEAGMAGPRLTLTGTVSGVTCGPIKAARVDFWQPDARGVYDKLGFKMRGHQFTDANGRYRLETIMPGALEKRAPHIHVRVQPPGKAPFTTQIFFANQPQNKVDSQFRPELAAAVTDTKGVKTATFDIVLNI